MGAYIPTMMHSQLPFPLIATSIKGYPDTYNRLAPNREQPQPGTMPFVRSHSPTRARTTTARVRAPLAYTHTTAVHDRHTRPPHTTATHDRHTRPPHTTATHDHHTRPPHTTTTHDRHTRPPHNRPTALRTKGGQGCLKSAASTPTNGSLTWRPSREIASSARWVEVV